MKLLITSKNDLITWFTNETSEKWRFGANNSYENWLQQFVSFIINPMADARPKQFFKCECAKKSEKERENETVILNFMERLVQKHKIYGQSWLCLEPKTVENFTWDMCSTLLNKAVHTKNTNQMKKSRKKNASSCGLMTLDVCACICLEQSSSCSLIQILFNFI